MFFGSCVSHGDRSPARYFKQKLLNTANWLQNVGKAGDAKKKVMQLPGIDGNMKSLPHKLESKGKNAVSQSPHSL